MDMATSGLTGFALNWAVSLITNPDWEAEDRLDNVTCLDEDSYDPSSDWAVAGPIIDRERITLDGKAILGQWMAVTYTPDEEPREICGPTPLIAAMRCYVASNLGDSVDIPQELLKTT